MTFIGPKPTEDVPEYAAPFRVHDVTVLDASGRAVAYADTPDADHDHEMAQAIADALNEKFGGEPGKTGDGYRYFASTFGLRYRVAIGADSGARPEFEIDSGEWAGSNEFTTLEALRSHDSVTETT